MILDLWSGSFNAKSGLPALIHVASAVGVAAIPVGISVGILRYRLYDIDRIVSRTPGCAIVTGLLLSVRL